MTKHITIELTEDQIDVLRTVLEWHYPKDSRTGEEVAFTRRLKKKLTDAYIQAKTLA